MHIAFAKPHVPHPRRGAGRGRGRRGAPGAARDITKAEGKPEQAWTKIVEGRLNAWYKDQVLLEQAYVKDDKQSITQLLGDATLVRFAQVVHRRLVTATGRRPRRPTGRAP